MPEFVFAPDAVSGRSSLLRLAGHQRIRYLLGVAGLAAAYYGAAKIGYALEFAGPVAAILWLPVGVAIAFLSLGGLRFWPGVLIGDLLANDYTTLPLGSALGQTFGNMLEVLVAALLIRRLLRAGLAARQPPRPRAIGRRVAAGTAISATVGPLSLLVGGVITAGELPDVSAHLVARRFRRRPGRGPARARLVPAAAAALVAWTAARSRRSHARGRRRRERVRLRTR